MTLKLSRVTSKPIWYKTFYPVAIEIGNSETAYGIVVPDLPGCFSAGDTLDGAMKNAGEAVCAWIEAALGAGEEIPKASSLESIRQYPEYDGWTFGIIDADTAQATARPSIFL